MAKGEINYSCKSIISRKWAQRDEISKLNASTYIIAKWKWFEKLDKKWLFKSQVKMKGLSDILIPYSFGFSIYYMWYYSTNTHFKHTQCTTAVAIYTISRSRNDGCKQFTVHSHEIPLRIFTALYIFHPKDSKMLLEWTGKWKVLGFSDCWQFIGWGAEFG